MGASEIRVVDRVAEKLRVAGSLGAQTGLAPVDVALDFAGHADLTLEALRALKPGGRLMLVAINLREVRLDAYADFIGVRAALGTNFHGL